jgi:hypothetical protein
MHRLIELSAAGFRECSRVRFLHARWRLKNPRVTSSALLKLQEWARVMGLDMFGGVCQAEGMKKQASDQSFHDRRYQERKRAEAAKKSPVKKAGEQKKEESSS